MLGLLVIFGPAVAFLIVGYRSADKPGTSWSGLGWVAAIGTVGWLGSAAVVPHTEGGATFLSTDPLFDDGIGPLLLYLIPTVAASVAAAWRRVAQPIAIGAAASIGPLFLAYFTTPQGDGDGLWILIFLMLPAIGLGFAGAAFIGASFTASAAEAAKNLFGRRVAAFAVDAALLGLIAGVPADALSSSHHEVAAVALVVVAGFCVAALPLAAWGATVGHRMFSLRVVDAETDELVSTAAAFRRVAVITVELLVSLPLFALPLFADVALVETKNLSVADRLTRTRVRPHKRPPGPHTAHDATG